MTRRMSPGPRASDKKLEKRSPYWLLSLTWPWPWSLLDIRPILICYLGLSLTEVKNSFCGSHTTFDLFYSRKLEKPVSGPSEKPYRWILRFEIVKLLWDVKKSKCAIPYKWGLESCGMMEGFQIWSQNLNQIKFDALFGHKMVEKYRKKDFCQFFTVFFFKKVVKCYTISILRTDLESSHHSATS